MSELNNSIKAAQLHKYKVVATGLFLLMAVLYMLSTWLLKTQQTLWLGYLKAFAEAAMVGALADWFAVTALFHHPMGIPIPHTNLIENRKKSIGDNLGGFVVNNFLNADTIRPYILQLNTSEFIAKWLGNEKNVAVLATAISSLLKDVVTNMNDKSITKFIGNKSTELLKDINLNEVLASGLDIIVQRNDHARILNYLTNKLRHYLFENETMIRERVKKESHFLIPGFVDNIIAAKITNGLVNYLSEIEQNPQHSIRNDINQQLAVFITDIRNSAKWKQELESIKESIVAGDKIQKYAVSIWKQLQTGILTDLESDTSAIEQYIRKTIHEMVANLQQNESMQTKLNYWVQHTAYKYVLRNTEKAGELISNTVGNWKGKDLSNKLELEVGKDLQFIRINGTLVGGLVGLLIYTITRIIENS